MLSLLRRWFGTESKQRNHKKIDVEIRKLRQREAYLRHRALEAPEAEFVILTNQADNISEAAFTAECFLDSLLTIDIMSETSAELTKYATLDAVETVLDTAWEVAELVASPIHISDNAPVMNELPTPPTTVLVPEKVQMVCQPNSICS